MKNKIISFYAMTKETVCVMLNDKDIEVLHITASGSNTSGFTVFYRRVRRVLE